MGDMSADAGAYFGALVNSKTLTLVALVEIVAGIVAGILLRRGHAKPKSEVYCRATWSSIFPKGLPNTAL